MSFKPNVWNTKRLKYPEDLKYDDFVSKKEDGKFIFADEPVSKGKGSTTSYDNILTKDEGSDLYLARLEFRPDGGHNYHAHTGVEVLYVLDGKLKATYRSKDGKDITVECKAGDAAYFPSGTPHAVWNVTNELCHFLVMKIGAPYHYEEIPIPVEIRDLKFNKP